MKIIINLVFLIFISVALFGCSDSGKIETEKTNKYVCEYINHSDNSAFSMIYNPKSAPSLKDCDNSILYNNQEKINNCIKEHAIIEKMFKNGECQEIIKNKHVLYGTKCEIEIAGEKIQSYGCENSASRWKALRKLSKIYNAPYIESSQSGMLR